MATEDGWEPSPRIEPDSPLLVWKTVPGTNVSLQVRNDDAGTVMLAYAADYNLTVEPLRDPDSACYTPTNSVSTSNHLNATAMDLNWDSHPFQTRGTFTPEQMTNLRALLAFYDGIIFWAGDWDDPVDEMHHQCDYGSYDMERDGRLAAWIKDHIRPDGFSVYRHDPAPGQNPTQAPSAPSGPGLDTDAITALYDAVPVINQQRAADLLPLIQAGLEQSQCNTVNRIAMWLAQIGYESGNFVYTEEIAKDGRYAPYIGRTWIQITWESNYAAFGQWCKDQGLIDNADKFVNDPASLADPKWAGIGPAWYWTVARPQINGLCDAGDLVGVTEAINGGTNGLDGVEDSRRDRWNQALGVGDRLLSLIQTSSAPVGEDDMFTDDDRNLLNQISGIFRDSKSALRRLGEGAVNTCAGFAWTADGLVHPLWVFQAAKLGHRDSIALLGEVAGADLTTYPDRAEDAKLAQAMLADIENTNPAALQAYLDGSVVK